MTRDEALQWVKTEIKSANLIKHILAVEAACRRFAEHFGEDIEFWGITGLLHDLDCDVTADSPGLHSKITAKWLKERNFDEKIIYAIQAHTDSVPPKSKLDWTLYAVDPATGLIVASALMHPSKSLAGLDVDFLIKRYKEKRFAAGARREAIAACSNLDLELPDFLAITLDGMRRISDEIGL